MFELFFTTKGVNDFEGQLLFISGYLDPANPRYSPLLDSDTFLQKPFSAEALLKKVKELLN